MGVGFFDITPDGSFGRVAINNWHQNGVITDAYNGTFLAVWAQDSGAQLLQSRPSGVEGLRPAKNIDYSGLFPAINMTVDADISVHAWSPLVPHDAANSSLPLAFIDVTLSNPTGADVWASAALSWQDVIARRMFDASPAQLDAYYGKDCACGWCTDQLLNNMARGGVDIANSFSRVATTSSFSAVGGGLLALHQHSPPLQPNKFTLQNYNDHLALAVLPQSSEDEVSFLPAFAVTDRAAAGALWSSFVSNGTLGSAPGFADTPLYAHAGEMASAVALRTRIPARGFRTIRFQISWFGAELRVAPGQDNRTFCGSAGYGKLYHNRFSTVDEVLVFGLENRDALEAGTRAVAAHFAASSLPPWLSFKIINSAYTLFTNALLTKSGHFSMMEGGMGGLAGTMDQRAVAHAVYLKLFPELDLVELRQFAATQNPDGSILHFDADIYAGVTGGEDGGAILGPQEYNDNTISFVWQLAKRYELTGDLDSLTAMGGAILPAVNFMLSTIPAGSFAIPGGSNTYDDFWELPVDSYMGSMGVLFWDAVARVAGPLGNATLASLAARMRDSNAADFVRALYNGEFFAYGCELDGTGRRDDILFTGQLAGQFLSRLSMWGDGGVPFNATVSAVGAQLNRVVAPSFGFYAPKVFNLTSGERARDPTNGGVSSVWPFYLESYTALLAIQRGFLADGLALLQQIQLTNLRLGLTWSQNLWNPGFISYVAAPVSWFIPDVLAGAALHVPDGTLFLSPFLAADSSSSVVSIPLFMPSFWAMVHVNASSQPRALSLEVTYTFGAAPAVTVHSVAAMPVGVSSPDAAGRVVVLKQPFAFTLGAVLDLSPYWDTLVGAVLQPPVLPITPP